MPDNLTAAPLIPCKYCQGAGVVPLQRDLFRTLQKLDTKTALMVDGLKEDGVTSNAINNRLVHLEKLGLARRRGKVSKWILWVKAEPKTKH